MVGQRFLSVMPGQSCPGSNLAACRTAVYNYHFYGMGLIQVKMRLANSQTPNIASAKVKHIANR